METETKSLQINETTEITVPLKTLISVVSFIVLATWYVFTTQSRIAELEHKVNTVDERFINYTKSPGRNTQEVALLRKDFECMRLQIDNLSSKVEARK